MFVKLSRKKALPLTNREANRIEQHTLTLSLYAVIIVALGSLLYGVYIGSQAVVLNGIFSLFCLVGSALSLGTSKMVMRPADKRFQFGYWHVEPLALSVNGLMKVIVCVYAVVNGIKGLNTGGNKVDADEAVLFAVVSGVVCAVVWLYEQHITRTIKSEIVKNDASEWLMDLGFSMVTLIGFGVLHFLPEPWYSLWARYADDGLVIITALLFLPYPLSVFYRNMREVLRMTSRDECVVDHVEGALRQISAEYNIRSHSSHVVKVGRSYFVEVNILVGEDFELQSIAEQDNLRERIWKACDMPLEVLWLSVCFTGDERWS